jgi:hypothetical protein
MDVQGAEADVVRDGQGVLSTKVKCIHIGTHGRQIEGELSETFARMGWHCRNRFPCNSTVATEFGQISFEDGVQTWINPEHSKLPYSNETLPWHELP